MATAIEEQRLTARDGRRFVVRASRPTDARAVAALFDAVRGEGRYLVTPPGARSQADEAFFIREVIRSSENAVLVAEADGGVVGNVMVLREQSRVQEHVGTLSIAVAHD